MILSDLHFTGFSPVSEDAETGHRCRNAEEKWATGSGWWCDSKREPRERHTAVGRGIQFQDILVKMPSTMLVAYL